MDNKTKEVLEKKCNNDNFTEIQILVDNKSLKVQFDLSKLQQIIQAVSEVGSCETTAKETANSLNYRKGKSEFWIKTDFRSLPNTREDKYLNFLKLFLAEINKTFKQVQSVIEQKSSSKTSKLVKFDVKKPEAKIEVIEIIDESVVVTQENEANLDLLTDDENDENEGDAAFNTCFLELTNIDIESDLEENNNNNMAQPDMDKLMKSLPEYKEERFSNFQSYVDKLKAYFKLMKLETDETKIDLVEYALAGDRKIKNTLTEGRKTNQTFDTLMAYAVNVLDGKTKQETSDLIQRAFALRLKNFDSAKGYYQAFVDIKADHTDDMDALDEKILSKAFIDGITPISMRSDLKIQKKNTVYENYEILEIVYEANKENFNTNYVSSSSKKNSRPFKKPFKQKKGFSQGSHGSNSRDWRAKNNPQPQKNPKVKGRCILCDEEGHHARECDDLKDFRKFRKFKANMAAFDDDEEDSEEDANVGNGGQGSSRSFSHCSGLKVGSNDNFLNNKLVNSRMQENANQACNTSTVSLACTKTRRSNDSSLSIDKSSDNDKVAIHPCLNPKGFIKIYKVNYKNLVYHDIKVSSSDNSGKIKFCIDCGAERSIISHKNAIKLGVKINTNYNFQVTGFDGNASTRIIGYTDPISVKIPGLSSKISFSPIVVDHEGSDLCGMDIINAAGGGDLSFGENGKMRWKFHCTTKNSHTFSTSDSIKIRAAETIKLKPGYMQSIKISGPAENKKYLAQTRNRLNSNVGILDGIVSQDANKICICNLSLDKEITIQKGQHVSNAYGLDKEFQDEILAKIGEINKKEKKFSETEINEKINEKTNHIKNIKIRNKLKEILRECIDAFDISSDSVGTFPNKVSINPDKRQIEVKPEKRRVFNPNTWGKINSKLQEFRDMDLTEPCPHPRICPANLVPAKRKGSSEIRLCVDYKRLNDVIAHNFFPLPTNDELLSNFSHATEDSRFVKCDVWSCFHNFELEEEDRYLTAYYTERGVEQWKKLPFGIKSAPGLVQQAMTNMLWSKELKLSPSTAKSVFIDDILTMFENETKALPDIERLLKHIISYGLKLKWSKCEFLKKKVDFMGTNLETSSQGIQISADPENITALQKLKKPHDFSSLKSFLGLCGWIAKFIKGIHLEMGPLYNILSKIAKEPKSKFSELWSENIDNLYNSIIEMVSKPCNLSVPRYSDPFIIEADASAAGFGGICYQIGPDGKKNVVSFASKALTKQAANYENIHRETACAVWAVDKFHKFFCCSPHETIVHTDNRVTSFIKSATSSKLKRWRSILEGYSIKLEHKKGSTMFVSDALSRLVRDGKSGDYVPDLSDEILEEVVIATAVGMENVELFQLHEKYLHCSADRLHKISGQSLAKCDEVIKSCFQCAAQSKVRENRQILGTIHDAKEKNETWMTDFVFHGGKKFVSLLDRSTRFFMAEAVNNREHKNIIKIFKKYFRMLGVPKRLVADREFISRELGNFLDQKDIKLCPLTRESPWLNVLERYHQEAKKMADRAGCTLIEAIETLNSLPFSKAPPGTNFKKISPATLFFENDKETLHQICDFLELESGKRSTRSAKLRGKNVTRFQRNFEVGDLVRFNLSNGIGWGKITAKNGSKMYQIDRIDSNGSHSIHSQQLEKVNLTEKLLRKYLE